MTFASGIFLIGILPWFMVMFFLQGRRSITIKSFMLFLMNTVFYIYGGAGAFLFVCVYSLCIWLFGLMVSKTKSGFLLGASVIISSAPLVFVKYTGFIIDTVNSLTGTSYVKPEIVIPIGISFFTFEAVSFLVDAKKEENPVTYNPFDVYLYLTFFPTVTSGPIIRFNEFKDGLKNLSGDIEYTKYIERIILGMGKKLLIADKLAFLANYYFDGTAVGNTYSALGLCL